MRVMMVLAFMISTVTLLLLCPKPLPAPPDTVQPGPGVTHVEAAELNSKRLERYRQQQIEYRVRLIGAIVAVVLILTIGYRTGRQLG